MKRCTLIYQRERTLAITTRIIRRKAENFKIDNGELFYIGKKKGDKSEVMTNFGKLPWTNRRYIFVISVLRNAAFVHVFLHGWHNI